MLYTTINCHVCSVERSLEIPGRPTPRPCIDFEFGGNLASGAIALYSVKQSETLPSFNYRSLFFFFFECESDSVGSKQPTKNSQKSPQIHSRAAVCWVISYSLETHASPVLIALTYPTSPAELHKPTFLGTCHRLDARDIEKHKTQTLLFLFILFIFRESARE